MLQRLVTNQEQQSLEKKEHIFQTAMELFKNYGYEQTTIRHICKAAGITIGSFYNFFKDKLGLIRYFYQSLQKEGQSDLDPTPENLQHPFQTIYHYFYRSAMIWEKFPPDVARQIFTESTKIMTGAYDTPYEETGMAKIITFLQMAQKQGTVRGGLEPIDVSLALISCATGCTYFWLMRYKNMSYAEMAEVILGPVFSSFTEEKISFTEAETEKSAGKEAETEKGAEKEAENHRTDFGGNAT